MSNGQNNGRGYDSNNSQQRGGYDSRDPRGNDQRSNSSDQRTREQRERDDYDRGGGGGGGNQQRTPSVPHLPAGQIKAHALDWSVAETKGSATVPSKEQIVITFEIKAEGPNQGKTITWFGFFTDDTWESSIKAMRACGWQGDDIKKLETLGAKDVMLVVQHEADTENGGHRARVRWVNPIGFVAAKPLEGAKLDSFASRVRAMSAKVAGGAATDAQKLPPVDNRDPRDQQRGDAPAPWDRKS